MLRINSLIDNIISDNGVSLIGYYGSRAIGPYEKESDTDLLIVLNESIPESAIGIHYQDSSRLEIDFLILSENSIHDYKISEYLIKCILPNFKILHFSCSKCQKILSRAVESRNPKLTDSEAENIFWHLRHIIFKAYRFENKSPEILILWSKFVYFLTLLWPRFYELNVMGELASLKLDSGYILRDFLSKGVDNIPPVKIWEEFLMSLPIGNKTRSKNLFIEISNLIHPYGPTTSFCGNNEKLRHYIIKWMGEKAI